MLRLTEIPWSEQHQRLERLTRWGKLLLGITLVSGASFVASIVGYHLFDTDRDYILYAAGLFGMTCFVLDRIANKRDELSFQLFMEETDAILYGMMHNVASVNPTESEDTLEKALADMGVNDADNIRDVK